VRAVLELRPGSFPDFPYDQKFRSRTVPKSREPRSRTVPKFMKFTARTVPKFTDASGSRWGGMFAWSGSGRS
jgi:hypothetical protein